MRGHEVQRVRMRMASTRSDPLAIVGGWPINIATQSQAVSEIINAASRGESFSAFTLNLDHLDKLKRDPRFRDAYATARFVTADGAPVAFLGSLQGTSIERTTGADLVIPLVQAAAKQRLPIYLFGTQPEILSGAAKVLEERAGPGVVIVGRASPELGFDPEGAVAEAAIDDIVASGARLCLVALGAPKQELFAAKAVARGARTGFVCIGAGLDFLVGAQVRAPTIMQKFGLEWFWRLASDPGRLTQRYARCALVLAEIAVLAPAKRLVGRILPKRAH
jgi:exopolysaccharide biosynthesis WecB/TagA/CpsF family protein